MIKNQIKIFDKLFKDTLFYDKTFNLHERTKINESPLSIYHPNKSSIIDTKDIQKSPNTNEKPLKVDNPTQVPIYVNIFNTTDIKNQNTNKTHLENKNTNTVPIKDKDKNTINSKPVLKENNIISNVEKEERKNSESSISWLDFFSAI